MIWAMWSFRARILIGWVNEGAEHHRAAKELVAQFGEKGLTLTFDVRSVVGPAHWQANVHKADPDVRPLPQATTDFARRILELYDTDIVLRHASRKPKDPRKQSDFSVPAHEFGHAIGYANPRGHIDEYVPSSAYYSDVHSIMNIGRRVRPRHLSLITETLAKIVPACRFRATIGHG
jgi:hypothetical protein